jgi:hypothetical protein
MTFLLVQVPGYLVFGTGQPTKGGFESALEHIFKDTGASKVLWTNMRQVRLWWREKKLTGENLKLVWAEFSTLS